MKKFLFSMICTLLPILASAQVQNEELTPYAVLSGDHTVLTFFYDNDKESQGGMDVGPFTSADERGWNEYCESIEQVVFVEAFANYTPTSTSYWFDGFTNLTQIDGLENLKTNNVTDMASMFDGCSSLTSLDLGGFETSQVTDMTYIFAGCSGLTSLDVNGFNTSNTKSMAGMFRDCSGLTSLDISAFDTSEATEMSEMFSGCSGLTSLDLGDNFNTSNVTTMNSMFSGCSNLSNLDVSGFETPEVTNMGAMFNNCSMLTSLDLGDNFNTSNVTNMEAMFSGCSNLESLDVSNFNTANVTAMGSMFGGCSKLTTLDLSGFDTSSATDLGHMFALCSGLTSLDVTGFNTSNATNMVCMFEGCSGLTSLDVSNFDTSNATNLSSMFILCSGLTSLDVSGFNTSNATDLSSMFAGCSGLTSLDVSGSFDTSNATNLSSMFEDCSSLTNLDLSGFNTANATNLSSMFIRCSGLTSLDVSNFNTANVTDMGNMFDGCSKLVSLDVSGLNTENVTNMGYMFSDCLKLTSPLDVSEFNTANVVRMDYMFNHCESLTALDVSNFNTANVTTMGSMFNYCSNLESLDVSNFNTEKVTYMAWMFADCSNLTSLDVSNFNTTNVTDMGAMFTSCSGLTELDLSNFDTSNTTTLELFFNKCSGLTSLDLSNFNTANVKNMDSMFSQCSGLETISTGNEWSTENIESGAGMFIGCTALVGGAGTEYNANHVDYTYARVDGGATNPGYFTDPNQPVPYAVLNEGNTVLTFYYDNQKVTRGGMSVGPFTFDENTGTVNSGWDEQRENIEQVVFDESFANCTTITSTSLWFYNFTKLTTIKDLDNLKTSNATDMSTMFALCSNLTSLNVSGFDTSKATNMFGMFAVCSSLTNLDLSSFNTSNVTNMSSMFYNCSSLTTIYVGEEWSTEKITSEESGADMFSECTALVGGASTTYDDNHIDYTYAHIDGGTTHPGYLTDPNQPVPYAVLNEGNTVLTFYYDNQKATRGGMSVWPFADSSQRGWDEQCGNIEQVVFNESFANCTTVTSTSHWFDYFSHLTTITGLENLITDNVTDMSYMFGMCSSLTSLDLSGFNTANVTNMSEMFYNCSSLITIYAGEGWSTEKITSEEYGANMFIGCTAIIGGINTKYDENHADYTYAHIDGGTSNPGYLTGSLGKMPYALLSENNTVLTFYYDDQKIARMSVGPFTEFSQRGWDEQREKIKQVVFDESFTNCTTITSTGWWFYGFTNLTTITGLENLKTDNVEDMSGMFSFCESLTNLDVSGFNTTNVTNMSEMFHGCSGMTSLDVSGFNTTNVTNLSGMFDGCYYLASLNVSGFDTSKAADMSSMFRECAFLINLDLRNFNTNNTTKMDEMFSGCSSLTTIYVEEGWSTENIEEGANIFKGCTALVGGAGTRYDENHADYTYAHIDEGASNPGYLSIISITEEPYAVLSDDNTVLTFYYDDQKVVRGGMNVGPFINSNQRGWKMRSYTIEHVVFDESFANCTTITSTSCWFSGFISLTTITGLENLKTDNVIDMSGMFSGCESLTTIDVSGFNTENVTNMSRMFSGCDGLTTIDVSGFNTENVTDMSRMFISCDSFTSLDLSTFNTSNVENMAGMFESCYNLISVDVSGFNTSKVKNMCGMFCESPNLTSIDVSGFDTSEVIDMSDMFTECKSLINLDVSGFVTSKATNISGMFGRCISLETLNLRKFNTANVSDMSKMFECDSLLTTIYVGEGWSTENISTEDAGANMFRKCTALVGGEGTTYDENHVDYTYARIDGGVSNPGYLTVISAIEEPYAVLNEDNSVLTFYYDDQKAARGGMDVGPFEQWGGQGTKSGWSDVNEQITTVVFDESFANCTTLTSTAYWFYGCENLTTIKNISNLKTDNVTDINSMFGDCHSLKSIDFSSLNLSNVTNMHQVFEDCRALESIDFSGVNTENVTNMGDLFLNCKSLKTIDISSFNTKNVTKMTSMFYKCDVLTTIYVGDGWTTKKVTESAQMFEKSPNLVGGRGTTYDENHIGIEYAHIDGGTSNPGYLTDINGASDETWAKLQSRIEYGTDVLAKAKEISSVDQALIEKLDEALQNANQMYKIHEASEDEVLHMIEVLNERINDVEEAMNQPASEETWDELKATIEYGTDVLAKAKEISTIDQWLIEELDMTLDSGNQMYKIHEASEEEVLNMIDELNWRIKEVEEAMNQPASDEAWAELNKAVETGEKLQTEAKGVSTVEPWALEELENMTAKGSEMYKVHTAGEEEVRHMTEELNQIINEVEEMMRKQPQGEASFDGLTAYVSGNATLDDAFKSVGGRSEAAKTIAAIVWNADNALTADMLSGIDNPNLLVYVTEASKAPSGVQNVIIDGVAAEIVLTDATGNNNFYCPQSFTAKSISYSRDFSQTTEIDVCRGWETIALPFDVQSITHESHGTLVPFGGSDNGYPFWLRQLSTNGLARATKIEANRPYLICMPNNIIYPPEYNQNGTVTFSSSNVTVPVTSARSSTSAGVTLHATFQQVTKSSSVYALNVGETRGEYPEGSVFEQNYRDIRPFQAYTTHRASTRSFITLESLGGNDDATGIEELRIKNSEFGDAEGVWYSLDGRRLDAKPTKKGVYVKDGRKIVIK